MTKPLLAGFVTIAADGRSRRRPRAARRQGLALDSDGVVGVGMTMSIGRLALAVVVLASIGCDAGGDRVYDDTTLRLTAYVAPRPGEVVLEWTGGPSGFRRWEYYMLGPGSPLPGVWRDVPSDRVGPTSRRMRLDLEPGAGYLFMIRERGDPRDPAETNPGAVARVAAPGVGEHGLTYIYGQPLEHGARFWLGWYGLWVTAPPEGTLSIAPWLTCEGHMQLEVKLDTLDTYGRKVRAYAELWVMLPHLDREEWATRLDGEELAEFMDTPGLFEEPGYELPVRDLTARGQAEQAGTPGERAAYRLLVNAVESMFNGYPPPAPESLERALFRIC